MWNIPEVHNDGVEHFTKERVPDDSMHTGALGVDAKYVGTAIAKLFEHDCFNVGSKVVNEKGMQILRKKMKTH